MYIPKELPYKFWISPMFIHPIYQGKGIAQKVLILIEEMFPEARSFELATILEEERNCFLYEKMGYKRTEVTKKLNDKTTLIYYKKRKVKRLKYALPFLCYFRLNIQF